ncbi:hypothetical protein BJ684DRAFT_21916, partial [Piptocephalis cylindrospora]
MAGDGESAKGHTDLIRDLQKEIEIKERARQEAMEVLDAEKHECGRLRDLSSSLEARLRDTAREGGEARSKILSLETEGHERKMRLVELEREVKMTQTAKERLEGDVDRLIEETSNLRREKATLSSKVEQAEKAQKDGVSAAEERATLLQRQLDDLRSEVERAGENRLAQESTWIEREEAFKAELSQQQRLCDMYERAMNEARARVDSLIEDQGKTEERTMAWRTEMEETLKKKEQVLDELEKMVKARDEIIHSLQQQAASLTPDHEGNADPEGQLSHVARLASERQTQGKTFTQVYREFTEVRETLRRVEQEKSVLQGKFTQFYSDVLARAPSIEEDRRELLSLREAETSQAQQLEEARRRQGQADARAKEADRMRREQEQQVTLLKAETKTQALQIHALLQAQHEKHPFTTPIPALLKESTSETRGAIEIDEVVYNTLTPFDSIGSLIEQNRRLLAAVREMGQDVRNQERRVRSEIMEKNEDMMQKANQAIRSLQEEINRKEVTAQSYLRERDMLRKMLHGRPAPGDTTARSMEGDTSGSGTAESMQLLQELQANFDRYRQEAGVDLRTTRSQLREAEQELSQLRVQLGQIQAKYSLEQERLASQLRLHEEAKQEVEALRKSVATHQELLGKMELTGSRAAQEAEEARAKTSRMEAQMVHLQAEREVRAQAEERSREERRAWTEERMTLTGRVEELRAALATAEERASGKEAESARATELIRATEAARVAEVSKAREAVETAEATRARIEREGTERAEALVREIRDARESLAKAETSLTYERGRVSDLEGRLL